MFLLAFFSCRANKQGLWVGIFAALVFTAWAVLTSPVTKGSSVLLDLGDHNYVWPSVMIGVIAHVIVLVVGWIASFCFAPPEETTRSMTIWGWLEMRKPVKAGATAAVATFVTGFNL
jgi:SSS family solute:Na+ symporter